MLSTSVTTKGQVTIPQALRQQFGIFKGTKVSFEQVNDHIELRVVDSPKAPSQSGFGMLKTNKKPVPNDFDVASLLRK